MWQREFDNNFLASSNNVIIVAKRMSLICTNTRTACRRNKNSTKKCVWKIGMCTEYGIFCEITVFLRILRIFQFCYINFSWIIATTRILQTNGNQEKAKKIILDLQMMIIIERWNSLSNSNKKAFTNKKLLRETHSAH